MGKKCMAFCKFYTLNRFSAVSARAVWGSRPTTFSRIWPLQACKCKAGGGEMSTLKQGGSRTKFKDMIKRFVLILSVYADGKISNNRDELISRWTVINRLRSEVWVEKTVKQKRTAKQTNKNKENNPTPYKKSCVELNELGGLSRGYM